MLGWIRRWWRDRHRRIFHFWDGRQWRRVDPVRIFKAINSVCPDFGDLLELIATDLRPLPAGALAREMSTGKSEGEERLLVAIRQAFEVQPLDQRAGLTDRETLQLLTTFLLYMAQLAENASPH